MNYFLSRTGVTLTPEEKLNVNGGWWQVVGVTILLDALLSELNVYVTY